MRFLQRRTHAAGMLAGKLHFAVLGPAATRTRLLDAGKDEMS